MPDKPRSSFLTEYYATHPDAQRDTFNSRKRRIPKSVRDQLRKPKP